mmetsp:Transcript_22232/g.52555  ORF Transcript_22232/g.52555 Transcript_22232/m.52555 type:complete len:254 (-) Transcript_22232:61-822(-)
MCSSHAMSFVTATSHTRQCHGVSPTHSSASAAAAALTSSSSSLSSSSSSRCSCRGCTSACALSVPASRAARGAAICSRQPCRGTKAPSLSFGFQPAGCIARTSDTLSHLRVGAKGSRESMRCRARPSWIFFARSLAGRSGSPSPARERYIGSSTRDCRPCRTSGLREVELVRMSCETEAIPICRDAIMFSYRFRSFFSRLFALCFSSIVAFSDCTISFAAVTRRFGPSCCSTCSLCLFRVATARSQVRGIGST